MSLSTQMVLVPKVAFETLIEAAHTSVRTSSLMYSKLIRDSPEKAGDFSKWSKILSSAIEECPNGGKVSAEMVEKAARILASTNRELGLDENKWRYCRAEVLDIFEHVLGLDVEGGE